MTKATVPLSIAEFLRVTLQIAKQSDRLDTATKERIGMVLALYEVKRDECLLNQGYRQTQINGMSKSAALALANYFEDKEQDLLDAAMDLEAGTYDMSEFEEAMNDNHPDT